MASESAKNIVFYGLGLGLTIGVGSRVRWLGLVLFGIGALLLGLHVAQMGLLNLLYLPFSIAKILTRRYTTGDFWWHLVGIIRLIESGVYVTYAIVLYRFFFIKPP